MQTGRVTQDNVSSIKFEDDYFKYAEFVDITFEGGHITSDFAKCTFHNVDWYWGIFNIVNFVECEFIDCTFRGTAFADCKFVDCQFEGTRFKKDNLGGNCSFDGTVARNCTLSRTTGFDIPKKRS